MVEADYPLLSSDAQRLSFELLRKLLTTLDQWGKAQGGVRGGENLDRVVMDGLLQTVTAICLSRELSTMGVTSADTQAFFRRIYRGEGLVKPEESETLLRLQARKDVLFTALKRAVSAFPHDFQTHSAVAESRGQNGVTQSSETAGRPTL